MSCIIIQCLHKTRQALEVRRVSLKNISSNHIIKLISAEEKQMKQDIKELDVY